MSFSTAFPGILVNEEHTLRFSKLLNEFMDNTYNEIENRQRGTYVEVF